MGVTIHYSVKDATEKQVHDALEYVKNYAKQYRIKYKMIEIPGALTDERVIDGNTGKVKYEWRSFEEARKKLLEKGWKPVAQPAEKHLDGYYRMICDSCGHAWTGTRTRCINCGSTKVSIGVKEDTHTGAASVGKYTEGEPASRYPPEQEKKYKAIGEAEEKRVVKMLAKEGLAHKISPELSKRYLRDKWPKGKRTTHHRELSDGKGPGWHREFNRHADAAELGWKRREGSAWKRPKARGMKSNKGKLPITYHRGDRISHVDLERDRKIVAMHNRKPTQPTWRGDVKGSRV